MSCGCCSWRFCPDDDDDDTVEFDEEEEEQEVNDVSAEETCKVQKVVDVKSTANQTTTLPEPPAAKRAKVLTSKDMESSKPKTTTGSKGLKQGWG